MCFAGLGARARGPLLGGLLFPLHSQDGGDGSVLSLVGDLWQPREACHKDTGRGGCRSEGCTREPACSLSEPLLCASCNTRITFALRYNHRSDPCFRDGDTQRNLQHHLPRQEISAHPRVLHPKSDSTALTECLADLGSCVPLWAPFSFLTK